jgi:hypothetical protein
MYHNNVTNLTHFHFHNHFIVSYIGQTKRSLKLRYQEHIRYINPQSAYALHILNNGHEYGPMHNTMKLLKQINKTKFLISYEQLYIQPHYHHKQLIPEQNSEHNPLYQLVYDQQVTPYPTKPPDQHPQSQ